MSRVGLIDTNFSNSSQGLSFLTIAQNRDGSLLGSAYSTNEDGTLAYIFGKWNRDGSRDTNFTSSFEALTSGAAHITVIEHEPGTNSYIAAIETQNEGSTQTHIARISESGELDNDFYNRFPIVHGRVNAIAFDAWKPATLASGAYDTIYIGGDFSGAGDYFSKNILCLSQSCDLNWTVDNDSGPNGMVNTILPLLDGTLLVGGDFTQFGGYPGNGIVRLNAARATGQTFVYFDKATFRGYEALQEITISVTRSAANTNEETFDLTVESLRGGTAVASYPTNITFAPGELQHEIQLPLINDASQGEKMFHVALSTEDESVSFTRSSAEVIIHDDEAPGTIDATYQTELKSPSPKSLWAPTAIAVQPDGKLLIGYWDGRPKLARLNHDGSLDGAFIQDGFPHAFYTGRINQIHTLNSGKIYISGNLPGIRSGAGPNFIYRLNSDGSLDDTFNLPILMSGTTDPDVVVAFAVLPDETLLVGGNRGMRFTNFSSPGTLFRINPNGSLHTAFASSPFPSPRSCNLILPLTDGKFLAQLIPLAGSNQVVRYKIDGPVDSEFNLFLKGDVRQILEIENYLYLCGSYKGINNSTASTIARVDAKTGVLDSSFSFSTDGVVTRILPAQNGKYYIIGEFTEIQGVERYRIARLNSDFSLDTSFDPGYGLDYQASTLIQLPDRNVLVGGGFTHVDLTPAPSLVRFNEEPSPGYIYLVTNRIVLNQSAPTAHIEVERLDGSQGTLSASIETFDQSAISGFNYQSTNTIITYADGEFGRRSLDVPLISTNSTSGPKTFGARVTINGVDEYVTILLLNEDVGELDSSFQISVPYTTTPTINSVAGLPDGRIYIGGTFTNIQGLPITNLVRLNADLTVDTNFNPVVNRPVTSISLQPNSDILIGGLFTSINNTISRSSARLRPDGKLDPAFNPGALGFTIPVKGIHAGSDIDSYLWGDAGLFWLTNGVPFRVADASISYPPFFLKSGEVLYSGGGSVVRLKPDFSRDMNLNNKLEYKTPLSAASPVPARAISLDRLGYILIGGGFNLVNGTEAARIARLSNTGSLDPAFLPNVGTNSSNKLTPNYVSAIQPLPTGQILVGGNFLSVDGQRRSFIARLNHDGSLDPNFDLDVQGSSVDQIIPMPDGGFVVLGSVTNVNGIAVDGIFKLHPMTNEVPFARFLWPTNRAEVVATGLVTNNFLQLQAWDPDGFLNQV
ncbi:MAG: Calx-beta domain-containing protein, partial [Verrucomicrobiota bacterium]